MSSEERHWPRPPRQDGCAPRRRSCLKTGSLRLSELLEEAADDDILAGLKVERVIASMPGTGKIKAKRLMESLGIAENRGSGVWGRSRKRPS